MIIGIEDCYFVAKSIGDEPGRRVTAGHQGAAGLAAASSGRTCSTGILRWPAFP